MRKLFRTTIKGKWWRKVLFEFLIHCKIVFFFLILGGYHMEVDPELKIMFVQSDNHELVAVSWKYGFCQSLILINSLQTFS